MSTRWGNLVLPDNDPQVAPPPPPAVPTFQPTLTRFYGVQAVDTGGPKPPWGNVKALGHGNILHWLDPATDIVGPATAEDYARELAGKVGRVLPCTDTACWCRQFDTLKET